MIPCPGLCSGLQCNANYVWGEQRGYPVRMSYSAPALSDSPRQAIPLFSDTYLSLKPKGINQAPENQNA